MGKQGGGKGRGREGREGREGGRGGGGRGGRGEDGGGEWGSLDTFVPWRLFQVSQQ